MGHPQREFEALNLSPRSHRDPLVVDLLAVYLDAHGGLDGVRRTCHELWTIASQRQPNSWSWDWYWDGWCATPKPVRLLDGLEHVPGVRRVTVDLGAHWEPGRHIRAGAVRDRDSAHGEILAAAAHFPAWVRAMDGTRVPHVLLSGYQVTIPEYSAHNRLPCLARTTFRRQISLTVDWADHSTAAGRHRSASADERVRDVLAVATCRCGRAVREMPWPSPVRAVRAEPSVAEAGHTPMVSTRALTRRCFAGASDPSSGTCCRAAVQRPVAQHQERSQSVLQRRRFRRARRRRTDVGIPP